LHLLAGISLAQASEETIVETPKYLKNYSITANPVLLLFSIFNADFNFGVSENLTAGIYTHIFHKNTDNKSVNLFNLGARLTFSLNHPRLTDGWYFSPYIESLSSSTDYSSLNIGALFGYQWVYKSGFTMMAALGSSYYSSKIASLPMSGLWPAIEFKTGFAF
jgi:hypothetical protein